MEGLNFELLQDLENALKKEGIPTQRDPLPRKGPPHGYHGVSLKIAGTGRAIYVPFHYFRKWTKNVFGLNVNIVDRNQKLFKNNLLKTEQDGKYWYGELTEDIYDDLLQHLVEVAREFCS